MSALSNIPPQAVVPLDAYDLAEIERSAERTGQALSKVDCADAKTSTDVIRAIGEALKFPPHFGANLDALYDCLTDLKPDAELEASAPGFVVILKNLPASKSFGAEQLGRLLDVFREAAEHYYDEKLAFRVFYSLAQH